MSIVHSVCAFVLHYVCVRGRERARVNPGTAAHVSP